MEITNRRDLRLFILPTIGLITIGFLIVNLMFMVKDSRYTDIKLASFKGSTRAAMVLNAFAIIAISLVCTSHGFDLKPRWIFKALFGWIGALIGLASAILTLNVIILKKINPQLVQSTDKTNDLSTNIEIVIWTLSTFSELVFFVAFGFLSGSHQEEYPDKNSAPLTPLSEKRQRKPPMRPRTPPSPQKLVARPYVTPEATMPWSTSQPPASRRGSWRESLASLHQVVRPPPPQRQQSKRKLLHRHTARSSLSRDTQSIASIETKSLSNSTRSDAFDSLYWDFDAPVVQVRDTFGSSTIPRKPTPLLLSTTLETIPGSQPVSPAKTLDAFTVMEQQGNPTHRPSLDQEAEDCLASFDHYRSYSRNSDRNYIQYERTASAHGRPMTILSASTATLPDNFPDRPPTSLSTYDRPPTSLSVHSHYGSDSSFGRPNTGISTHSRFDSGTNLPRPPTAMSTHSLRRPTIPSRPTTPSLAEAHIHPLFRTDSPTPPPNASANTTVIASPFSGQVIGQLPSQPSYSRPYTAQARSGSRSRYPDEGRSTPIQYNHAGPTSLPGSGSSGRSTPVASSGLAMAIPEYILGASRERLL